MLLSCVLAKLNMLAQIPVTHTLVVLIWIQTLSKYWDNYSEKLHDAQAPSVFPYSSQVDLTDFLILTFLDSWPRHSLRGFFLLLKYFAEVITACFPFVYCRWMS